MTMVIKGSECSGILVRFICKAQRIRVMGLKKDNENVKIRLQINHRMLIIRLETIIRMTITVLEYIQSYKYHSTIKMNDKCQENIYFTTL